MSELLRQTLEQPPSAPERMVETHRSLHQYRDRYEGVRLRWEAWAGYLNAGPLEFESLSYAMVGDLLEGFRIERNGTVLGQEVDFQAESPQGDKVGFECKSLERGLTADHLAHLATRAPAPAQLVLLVNSYRSVPSLQRPESPRVSARLPSGLHLITSLEFFRDVLRSGLEQSGRSALYNVLYPGNRRQPVPRKGR